MFDLTIYCHMISRYITISQVRIHFTISPFNNFTISPSHHCIHIIIFYTRLYTLFILSCCSLTFSSHTFKLSELTNKISSDWINATVIMFASPAVNLIYYLLCSSEANIRFISVQRWKYLLIAFTWVLISTLAKFVTIWMFLLSTKANMLVGYIIDITSRAPWNGLPTYKQCLKTFR